jgi:hypothetical protein
MSLPIKEKNLVVIACVIVVCATVLAVTFVATGRPELAFEVAKGVGGGILAAIVAIFLIMSISS